MSTRNKDASQRGTARKKPYRAPKLTVHGDIGALTRTKKGKKSDGAGKPKTKASGTNA